MLLDKKYDTLAHNYFRDILLILFMNFLEHLICKAHHNNRLNWSATVGMKSKITFMF